jgi:putative hydrolase of the HAD superfamily
MPLVYKTIFFDLDDTLYPQSSGLWLAIKERMNLYMHERLGIAWDEIPAMREMYFQQYGTTLRGLEVNYTVDELDYLDFVHDLPLGKYIAPDPNLRTALEVLSTRKFIFTNANRGHAQRVLTALGVDDLFDGIIDVTAISPFCKPMRESFEIAMRLAGNPAPQECMMIDDLPRTTKAAREFGMFSILFGKALAQPDDANAVLNDWSQLKYLMNGDR